MDIYGSEKPGVFASPEEEKKEQGGEDKGATGCGYIEYSRPISARTSAYEATI